MLPEQMTQTRYVGWYVGSRRMRPLNRTEVVPQLSTEPSGAIGFHFITAGEARVTSGATVRRTLGVGDYFGEVSVIDGQPRSASVEAVGTLETFAIHPPVFQKIIDDHPDFARGLLVVLCKRLREAEKRGS